MNTLESLNYWAQSKPDAAAFIDHTQEISYLQLHSLVMRMATFLDSKGIKAGSIVNVHLPSFLGWAAILSLEALGATSVSRPEVAASKPILIPDWHIARTPDPVLDDCKNIIFDVSEFQSFSQIRPITDFAGFSSQADIVRLFLTSGTTGDVKFVPLKVGTIPAYVTRKHYWDQIGSKTHLLLNPLSAKQTYGYGLKSIYSGKPMYFCSAFDYNLPAMIRRYNIDSISGSGQQVSKLLELIQQTGTQLPNLRNVVLSGSEPNPRIVDKIRQELNCKIFNAYGSTEVGNVCLSEIGEPIQNGARLNEDVTVEIVDENNQILPRNEIGLIRYRSESMTDSYYKNIEDTKKFFRDGFFYPGDLGKLTQSGKLILAGRLEEVINIGGVKINPDQIDNIAMSHLGVIDCASFQFVDEQGEEKVAIAIVITEDFDNSHFTRTMKVKSPVALSLIVERKFIPRNENGKVLRRQLQEDWTSSQKSK